MMIGRKLLWFVLIYHLTTLTVKANDQEDSIRVIDGKRSLTSQFCDRNRNLATDFHFPFQSIEMIVSGALYSCENLKEIAIYENELTTLDSDLFKYNLKVESLDMSCNKITVIPSDLFSPLENLKFLDLNDNPLKTMPPVFDVGLNRLEWLGIANIEIFAEDIDVEKIKDELPSLNRLNIGCNNIDCTSLNKFDRNFR